MPAPSTATAVDIFNALQKRLSSNGYRMHESQLLTLTIDIMNVINTDAANAVSHAASEIGKNPVRPFGSNS